ncbi:hypothetical protein CR103_19805 [Massilia psychrophila]|uniref:Uncharacterized protein n=1 Tax=Massilia psychrophila TaxID=1603353 RepID=A0A2G8SXB7_9BURK|nr:hypothetical protein CR103_19805 [Massilia psychrophila]GGE91271.1 hypothetical protein GCM10008020_40320 [Massilia psychrophila]
MTSVVPSDLMDEDVGTDRRFEAILREALNRPPAPTVTEKSMCEGAALMAEFRRGSADAPARRIERKELITGTHLWGAQEATAAG